MKREKHISRIFAVLLAFALGYAGVACVATGFDLNVDLEILATNCFVLAVIAVLAVSKWWTNLLFFGALLLWGNHLWYDGNLERSLEGLLYEITIRYDTAYGWGILYWNVGEPVDVSVDLALGLLALPSLWLTAYTVVQRRPAIFAVAVSAIPLGICLVVTNTVPHSGAIMLLLTAVLLLLLTQTVRRRQEKDGNRLTALALIPALLCTALLFWAVPQEGYSPHFSTPQWMQGLIDLPGLGGNGGGQGIWQDLTMDLSTLGPKSQSYQEVMEVFAEQEGILYLRGQSYDVYDGTSWMVSDVDTTKDSYWPNQKLTDEGFVRIVTKTAHEDRFVPYYPRGEDWKADMVYGRMTGSAVKTYIYNRQSAVMGSMNLEVKRSDPLVAQCLNLPADTERQAKEIIKTLVIQPTESDSKRAAIIRDYVQGIAEYDMGTLQMPDGETDFAIWFLTEAETGYCVHFATAATVLLRAANIPARYVTGYMVNANEKGVKVVERHAHAWVEYLDSDRGWTVLDATPEQEPEPTVTQPSETTKPPETKPNPTTESTEPTLPTQSGETVTPTQSTSPTQPTDATETTEPTLPGATPISEELDLSGLWKILQLAALLTAAGAVLFGPYWLRLSLRRRKMYTGEPNRQALACWREVLRQSKLLRQSVPEELEALAEKAKFSQYSLTAAELGMFHDHLAALKEVQKAKGWLFRILFRWLFATE